MQTYLLTEACFNLVLSWGVRNPSAIELELERQLDDLPKFQDKLDFLQILVPELREQIAMLPSEGVLGGLGADSSGVAYASQGDTGTIPVITDYSVGSFRSLATSALRNLQHLQRYVSDKVAGLTQYQNSTFTPLTIVGTQVNAVGVVLLAIEHGLFDDKISDYEIAHLFRIEPNDSLSEDAISSIRQKLHGNKKTADQNFTRFVLGCLKRLDVKQLRILELEIEKLVDGSSE